MISLNTTQAKEEFGAVKKVSTKTSPTLDPRNMDEFKPKKDAVIRSMQTALQQAQRMMHSTLTDHNKIMNNQMNPPVKNASLSRKNAWKNFKATSTRLDSARESAQTAIEQEQASMWANLKKHENGKYVQETREYVRRELPDENARRSFLLNAIENKDEETLSAVLMAPPHLSGLKENNRAHIVETWKRTLYPEKVERINTLEKATGRLDRAGQAYLETITNGSIYNDAVIDAAEETVV